MPYSSDGAETRAINVQAEDTDGFDALPLRHFYAGFWRRFFAFGLDFAILTVCAHFLIYLCSLTPLGPFSLYSGFVFFSVGKTMMSRTTIDPQGRRSRLSIIVDKQGVLPIFMHETLIIKLTNLDDNSEFSLFYPYYPDRYDFFMTSSKSGKRVRVPIQTEDDLRNFANRLRFNFYLFAGGNPERIVDEGMIAVIGEEPEEFLSFRDMHLIDRKTGNSFSAVRPFDGILFFMFLVYFVLMEKYSVHGSLGKRVLRIRVVTKDQTKLSWGNATCRTLSKILSFALLGAGFVMIVFTKNRQGLHDKAAGTFVVKDRAIAKDMATSFSNLAVLYKDQGRYAEAETLYQRALAIDEKTVGPEHLNVATSLNNLAELYRDQARYVEAEPLYQRSLAIKEKVLGPEHPDVATSLINLAELYRDEGRHAEAEPLYQRALTIKQKAL